MHNRRKFLGKAGALAGLVPASLSQSLHGSGQTRTETKPVKGRRRRIVWNNDGSDMLQPAYAGGKWPIPMKSVKAFLEGTLKCVEGTQVDSIFYCAHVNEPDWEIPTKYIKVLGANPVKHVVDFAHRNGMEFFYTIRMNDVHAGRYPPKPSYWPPFRLKHPELLMGYISREHWEKKVTPWVERFMAIEKERWERKLYDPQKTVELRRLAEEEHPLKEVFQRDGVASRDLWFWAGYDWALPPVRARYLEVVEGACQRYDLEGVELDWLRHTGYFKLGEERRNLPIMNDFVHQVRQRLDHYAQKRGRPILLAVRTPDTIDASLSIGLDPETWIRKGWVDLVMAGTGLMPFSVPMAEWVDLGHRYHVPVYGCLDRLYATFRPGRPKFDMRDPDIEGDDASNYDSVHAACHRFWDEGVDGIYLYDWHTHHGPTDPQDYGTVPRVGEPGPLVRRNKLYRIDTDYYYSSGAIGDSCMPPQLPKAFTTQAGPSSDNFTLRIADDPGAVARATLQTRWKRPGDASRASWQLNGTPLSDRRPLSVKGYGTSYGFGFQEEAGWSTFDVSPGALKRGDNRLEIVVQPPGAGNPARPAELLEIRLSIGYA